MAWMCLRDVSDYNSMDLSYYSCISKVMSIDKNAISSFMHLILKFLRNSTQLSLGNVSIDIWRLYFTYTVVLQVQVQVLTSGYVIWRQRTIRYILLKALSHKQQTLVGSLLPSVTHVKCTLYWNIFFTLPVLHLKYNKVKSTTTHKYPFIDTKRCGNHCDRLTWWSGILLLWLYGKSFKLHWLPLSLLW